MNYLLLLSVVCFSSGADVTVQWSEWVKVAGCSRKCIEDTGMQTYERDCFRCVDVKCTIVSEKLCPGQREKRVPCYNATTCTGHGLYIGDWTEWSTPNDCPPGTEPCRGALRRYTRQCVLPARYIDRTRDFECPEDTSADKIESCPCARGVWSDWSEWSRCPCTGLAVHRRQRSCTSQPADDCRGAGTQSAPCLRDVTLCSTIVADDGELSRRRRRRSPRQATGGERPPEQQAKLRTKTWKIVLYAVIVVVALAAAALCFCAPIVVGKKKKKKEEEEERSETTTAAQQNP